MQMQTVLLVISIILIILVLLQSGKSERTAGILGGASSDLFTERKERGSELVISRITLILGLAFFIISLVASF